MTGAAEARRSVATRVAPSGRSLVVLFLCAGLLGCIALPPPPPLGKEAGTKNLAPDEQALWKKSRELQYGIEQSGLLFDDPQIDAYLARVLERVTPPALEAASLAPRVEVISNVNIDGYSFANGVLYIHTALLAHMQDETQLALFLSRELAHVAGRHAVQAKRMKRLRADSLAWIGVGSSLVQGGAQLQLLAQAASITSAVGFGRALESQADEQGLAFLDAAGYAVAEAPAFYEMTLAYLAEVHAQGIWGWVPFAPPAEITGRIDDMKALIQSRYATQTASRPPQLGPAAFRRKIHPATLRQAELELAAGLFVSAEGTARLATESGPADPNAWILLGRALSGERTKPLPGRTVPPIGKVRGAYEEALRLDSRNAPATQAVGMTYYRTTGTARSAEDTQAALRYLRRYLELEPDAGDRGYVLGYIEELEGESR